MADPTYPTLSEFLAPVMARVAALKGIPPVDQGDPPVPVYDASIQFAVETAYTLICAETKRKFLLRQLTDRHYNVSSLIFLREPPITEIKTVTDQDGDLLLVNEDYTLQGSTLLIGAATDIDAIDVLYNWLNVTYIGGMALADADERLFAAFVMQALACYHRRDLVGLYSISSGQGGFVNVPSNSATSLVPAVIELLRDYKYVE